MFVPREVQRVPEIPEGAEPGMGRYPGTAPGENEEGKQHQHWSFGDRVTETGDWAASESQENEAAAPVPPREEDLTLVGESCWQGRGWARGASSFLRNRGRNTGNMCSLAGNLNELKTGRKCPGEWGENELCWFREKIWRFYSNEAPTASVPICGVTFHPDKRLTKHEHSPQLINIVHNVTLDETFQIHIQWVAREKVQRQECAALITSWKY